MARQAGGVTLETIKKEYEHKIYIPSSIKEYIKDRRLVFFDIETLGLNPQLYPIILIGLSYQQGDKYIVEQFFAEGIEEESDILSAFKGKMHKDDIIVTYNGKNFDVPFVNNRMDKFHLDFSLNQEHLDVICYVRPNKVKLGLENCKLKSVEKFLDLNREDTIDGAESITLYNRYAKTGDEEIKQKILLHNYEDVFNLPGILKVFDYIPYGEQGVDCITSKQKSFLKSLLNQNNQKLSTEIESLTKKEASKLIDYLLNGTACEYKNLLESK